MSDPIEGEIAQLEIDNEELRARVAELDRLNTDLAMESHALQARVAELEAAIVTFCNAMDWSADIWKRQPHVAALFAIRDSLPPTTQEDQQ